MLVEQTMRRRFSIVITCYNQRSFIRAAVDSALFQSLPSKETIVVDDGSNDGSLEILQEYGDSIHLVRVWPNQGAIAARNRGAAIAGGQYLVFLDGDDLLRAGALNVYERIVAQRSPKIILGRTQWFEGHVPLIQDDSGAYEVVFAEYAALMSKDRGYGLSASSIVVDREVFQDAGGWSPGIFHLDCIDLCVKLGYSGRAVLICAPRTVFYRLHKGNSIHIVPPFLQMAHRIMDKERGGQYPGGRKHRFERYAWLGGVLAFWMKRGLRARLYRDAFKLVAAAWPMILAGVIRRSIVQLKGRRPLETIRLLRTEIR